MNRNIMVNIFQGLIKFNLPPVKPKFNLPGVGGRVNKLARRPEAGWTDLETGWGP